MKQCFNLDYLNSLNVQHPAPEAPEGMLIDKVIICARELTCTISFMEESDVTCCLLVNPFNFQVWSLLEHGMPHSGSS